MQCVNLQRESLVALDKQQDVTNKEFGQDTLCKECHSVNVWRGAEARVLYRRSEGMESLAPDICIDYAFPQVLVDPGTTVLQAAALVGVEIPRFCFK